jgi:hypothetical protein
LPPLFKPEERPEVLLEPRDDAFELHLFVLLCTCFRTGLWRDESGEAAEEAGQLFWRRVAEPVGKRGEPLRQLVQFVRDGLAACLDKKPALTAKRN